MMIKKKIRRLPYKKCGNKCLYVGEDGKFSIYDLNTKEKLEDLPVRKKIDKHGEETAYIYFNPLPNKSVQYLCGPVVAKKFLDYNPHQQCLIYKDGNHMNFKVENLKVISRHEYNLINRVYEVYDLDNNLLVKGSCDFCKDYLNETEERFLAASYKQHNYPNSIFKGKYRIVYYD